MLRQGRSVPGELTDEGRISTTQLGQRLRHLYIDQLEYVTLSWIILIADILKISYRCQTLLEMRIPYI
jgi:hypothetical protein